ncbi:MAG: hypothetical protein K2X99_00300 [Gemmatimonadaceae bacterium]|nr:hypothetical protein [Gemmatimonadaceae bacterium]
MHRLIRRARIGLIVLGLVGARVEAQQLAPVTEAQQCRGERISRVTFKGIRRELLDKRFAFAARAVEATVEALQPPTRVRIVRGFLLLKPGQRCVEQARTESERILRAQPYISDAAIRVMPDSAGTVRLEVETIDEIVLYVEAWGTGGLPAGIEVGTGNAGGAGVAVRGLVELGRGNEWGWGARYRDTQFAGRPIILDVNVRSRPLVDGWNVTLQRPFYTNFQQSSWSGTLNRNADFSTLRDSAIGHVSVEYQRTRGAFSWNRRLGGITAPWNIGVGVDWEEARALRTVQFLQNGPVTIDPPDAVRNRYPFFDATRAGASVGYRRIRFRPMRGLGALSAPQDIALGGELWTGARQGIAALQREPVDRIGSIGGWWAAGSARSMLRLGGGSEWISARRRALPAQRTVNGWLAWLGKVRAGDLTLVSLGGNWAANAREPTQLTFRNDDGLLGHRTSNLGGAARLIVNAEHREQVRSPIRRTELAFSALYAAGRLWAGDAPFGVTLPWQHSIGAAMIVAIPAGSKQSLRIEYGRALRPPAGQRGYDVRILYSDFTSRF